MEKPMATRGRPITAHNWQKVKKTGKIFVIGYNTAL